MSRLDEHIRIQRPPWGATIFFGAVAVGLLGYGTWWILHRRSPPRLEDFGAIAIAAVFGAIAAWIFFGNKRAIAEMHRFLARPAEDVAWIYVHVSRATRWLVLSAVDGTQTNIYLNRSSVYEAPSDAEIDEVLREAAQRYPRATVGFHPSLAAQFASNPRALLRS
jgi:hypothetical protein